MYNFELTDPSFLPHVGCDVRLTLNPGQLLLLIGENGIGKSTLLRRISRHFGTQVSVIEQGGLDFFYDRKLSTVKKIILSHLDPGESERFIEIWKVFRLDAKEERFVKTLSGGEGQMVKICIGLAPDRAIYLMDEPSQYLDSEMKACLNKVITKILKESKSFLVIEHDKDWIQFPHTALKLAMEENTLRVGETWNT